MKHPNYIKNTFKFDEEEGKERLQKYEEDQEFFCDTCYESVKLDEACIMSDCGHGLCNECFKYYCEEKVRAGPSCVKALCPVQPCGNFVSS